MSKDYLGEWRRCWCCQMKCNLEDIITLPDRYICKWCWEDEEEE